MRKIYILLLACPLLSLFVACNDNDYKASVTELRLVLVKPTNVYSGEIATILGRNFSTVPEENAVFINDQQATVIEAFKDELKIILPEMAPGKYSIRVKSPSGELTGLELNYLKTPDQEYIVQTIVGQKGVFEMTDGVGTEATTQASHWYRFCSGWQFMVYRTRIQLYTTYLSGLPGHFTPRCGSRR